MMPWRDQLKLGWKAIRWVYWPSDFPLWANIAIWICSAAVVVSIAAGITWGWVGAIAICVAIGVVTWKQKNP